jgi:hypothetical protein
VSVHLDAASWACGPTHNLLCSPFASAAAGASTLPQPFARLLRCCGRDPLPTPLWPLPSHHGERSSSLHGGSSKLLKRGRRAQASLKPLILPYPDRWRPLQIRQRLLSLGRQRAWRGRAGAHHPASLCHRSCPK